MNFAQYGSFVIFIFAVLLAGSATRIFMLSGTSQNPKIHISAQLGETLLLGGIMIIGELLLLSLAWLYRAHFLWVTVLMNYLFLFHRDTRVAVFGLFKPKIAVTVPGILFCLLLFFFILRNSYFMFDIDSISTYLTTQKLWLIHGTSVFGSPQNDIRIFVPQFDAVPYSLGLSLFGNETLFPQLVNLFWRLIAVMLVYGYASYRFNGYYGLAAVFFVILDQHFFYSGVNQWILINGSLIALLFAAAYNLWEAKSRNSSFNFLLALVFLSQLLANKYQMLFVLIFMVMLGLLIQQNPIKIAKDIIRNKRWLLVFIISLGIGFLWNIRNWIVTGDPVFPVFADKFGSFNFTHDMVKDFIKIFGGLSLTTTLKYLNYLFIWPGITAAKYIAIMLSFLPLIILAAERRPEKKPTVELAYWLGLSGLTLVGICLFCHQDPRYYRYPLGIFSFCAVFSLNYVLEFSIGIKHKLFLFGFIVFLSVSGFKIAYQSDGFFLRPTLKENLGVLSGKIRMRQVIDKAFPYLPEVLEEFNKNADKTSHAAWDAGQGMNFPAFLLPPAPEVSPWLTTVIKWDSYSDENLVTEDLKRNGIKWVMRIENGKLVFLPAEKYAAEAVKTNFQPKKVFYDYGFPPELSEIKY